MTDEELQKLTEDISITFFKKKFEHRAVFNSRLKTTGGRYLLSSHNIEINRQHAEVFGEEEIISILKHELCHYHLHREGRGYQHKDADFKALLQSVGGTRFCQNTGQRRQNKTRYGYTCESCGINYQRKRKIDTKKYRCGSCTGHLKLVSNFRVL